MADDRVSEWLTAGNHNPLRMVDLVLKRAERGVPFVLSLDLLTGKNKMTAERRADALTILKWVHDKVSAMPLHEQAVRQPQLAKLQEQVQLFTHCMTAAEYFMLAPTYPRLDVDDQDLVVHPCSDARKGNGLFFEPADPAATIPAGAFVTNYPAHAIRLEDVLRMAENFNMAADSKYLHVREGGRGSRISPEQFAQAQTGRYHLEVRTNIYGVEAVLGCPGVIEANRKAHMANCAVGPGPIDKLPDGFTPKQALGAVIESFQLAAAANCMLIRHDDGHATLQATREIKAGEELCWPYGADYWANLRWPGLADTNLYPAEGTRLYKKMQAAITKAGTRHVFQNVRKPCACAKPCSRLA